MRFSGVPEESRSKALNDEAHNLGWSSHRISTASAAAAGQQLRDGGVGGGGGGGGSGGVHRSWMPMHRATCHYINALQRTLGQARAGSSSLWFSGGCICLHLASSSHLPSLVLAAASPQRYISVLPCKPCSSLSGLGCRQSLLPGKGDEERCLTGLFP